jgi:phospholipase C
MLTGIASSGAPLVGVIVSGADSKGNVILSTQTDATGRYYMKLNSNGPFVLTVPFNDIDGSPAVMSSVFTFNGNFSDQLQGKLVQANINPLTSLITSRVLGIIPTSVPTSDQLKNAIINPATVMQAAQDITALFQPVYTALAIPNSEASDPIGSTEYQAKNSDPLDNLFTLARFNVSTGQVSIGTKENLFVVSVPAAGALPDTIPTTAVNSIATLNAGATRTPITNVIVVIGENRAFDSIFATYEAPAGQTIKNLLSQGIINADGTPGPNFGLSQQNKAVAQTTYSINPTRSVAFATLPQPTQMGQIQYVGPPTFIRTLGGTLDPRFPANLDNGSFQQTKYVPYATPGNPIGAVTADPPHRFFQMWQQTGGTNDNLDMYTWVAVTAGQGGSTPGVTPANPAQGAELMAFLNMHTGDIPSWKSYASQYAISDNYHQSIMGGTGANFFAIATGDVPYFNLEGVIAKPFVNQIENPNPDLNFLGQTNPNFYIQDGYRGGSYVNCSDSEQPGVAPILAALVSKNVQSKCEDGKYYLVNNYGWGYDLHGNIQPVGPNNFTLPPQTVPTIAEALATKNVSWKWYTGAREAGDILSDLTLFGLSDTPQNRAAALSIQYNAIGDPLVASTKVMTSPLKAGLAGLTTLYNDIANGTLPAVSFVVPKNLDSGHPGYSVQAKYENFTKELIAKVQANPELWKNTAIIITTDEGGGYFDTGPIQMQDFFGDGPRIPLMVISPYARTNHIDHIYHDHASLLKFIQRNWKLDPLSERSRDNHPIPVTTSADLYKPINTTPSVGDLMTMFAFESAPQAQ